MKNNQYGPEYYILNNTDQDDTATKRKRIKRINVKYNIVLNETSNYHNMYQFE